MNKETEKRWTKKEKEILKKNSKKSISKIIEILKENGYERTKESVAHQRKIMGLNYSVWTKEEEDIINNNLNKHLDDVVKILKRKGYYRTPTAVLMKQRKLGLYEPLLKEEEDIINYHLLERPLIIHEKLLENGYMRTIDTVETEREKRYNALFKRVKEAKKHIKNWSDFDDPNSRNVALSLVKKNSDKPINILQDMIFEKGCIASLEDIVGYKIRCGAYNHITWDVLEEHIVIYTLFTHYLNLPELLIAIQKGLLKYGYDRSIELILLRIAIYYNASDTIALATKQRKRSKKYKKEKKKRIYFKKEGL